MKKQKILLSVIIFAFILLIATIVNAADITAEQIVTSTDGSMDYLIKGLNLEEGSSYEWAIEKTSNATIENWYEILNPEYSTGTVKISLLTSNQKQLDVLKSTDTGYITIRKVGEDTNIIQNYKIDLKLPLLKTYTVYKDTWFDTAPTNPAYDIKKIYGILAKDMSFMWEKITDADIVNNYIDNNHDLSRIKSKEI